MRFNLFGRKRAISIKPYGKERQPQKVVKDIVNGEKSDSWKKNGNRDRIHDIFYGQLDYEPINFLISLKEKNPEILIGGSAKGEYITPLTEELKKKGVFPHIDIFNLTTTTGEIEHLIREDLSIGQAMETIASNPEKYNFHIEKMRDRYNLIVFPSSAGYHTLYPAFNVFSIALMLKKTGRAYVEIPTIGAVEFASKNYNNKFPKSQVKRIQEQITNIEKIVKKTLNTYFKKDVSRDYDIKILKRLKTKTGLFIRIIRK